MKYEVDSERGLLDVCEALGYGAVDSEIEVWIESGAFDEQVQERAEVIGLSENTRAAVFGDEFAQKIHRDLHPDGPWGWDFCFKCRRVGT